MTRLIAALLALLTGCSCFPIDYSCQDPNHPPRYGRDGHNECAKAH